MKRPYKKPAAEMISFRIQDRILGDLVANAESQPVGNIGLDQRPNNGNLNTFENKPY